MVVVHCGHECRLPPSANHSAELVARSCQIRHYFNFGSYCLKNSCSDAGWDLETHLHSPYWPPVCTYHAGHNLVFAFNNGERTYNHLFAVSWRVSRFMACLSFHGVFAVSWRVCRFMTCLPFHGVFAVSWRVCRFMACLPFHGVFAVSWRVSRCLSFHGVFAELGWRKL